MSRIEGDNPERRIASITTRLGHIRLTKSDLHKETVGKNIIEEKLRERLERYRRLYNDEVRVFLSTLGPRARLRLLDTLLTDGLDDVRLYSGKMIKDAPLAGHKLSLISGEVSPLTQADLLELEHKKAVGASEYLSGHVRSLTDLRTLTEEIKTPGTSQVAADQLASLDEEYKRRRNGRH